MSVPSSIDRPKGENEVIGGEGQKYEGINATGSVSQSFSGQA